MATTTIQFNNGNPFSVGSVEVHSASHVLPATVTALQVNVLDPNGDWVNPANAGGTFVYGVQYSTDGGTTWQIAISNGNGDPVGLLDHHGNLPSVFVSSATGLDQFFGMPVRAFASCDHIITIGASATVTT
jgi:hypothetical protein